MILFRLIVLLAFGAVALEARQAFAQQAFPAPLPGEHGARVRGSSPFPPVNGSAPSAYMGGPLATPSSNGAKNACMDGFAPLRKEAEENGKQIKAASERRAPPDEACKLIGNFAQSEIRMIEYVEANSAKCGVPPQIADQLKNGHKITESLQKKLCAVAEQRPGGPVGDFWPDFWMVR